MEPMQFFIFFILLAAALLGLVTAVNALQKQPTTAVLSINIAVLAAIVWAFGYLFELAYTDIEDKLFWSKISYIGIVTLPPAWFTFALQYTHHFHRLNRYTFPLLLIMPLTTLIILWSQQTLIWENFTILPSVIFPSIIAYSYGGWFWVHTIYSYTLILLGVFFMLRAISSWVPLLHWQRTIIIFMVFTPLIGNVIYLFDFTELDLTPFGFIITSVSLALGVAKVNILDVVPIAHQLVLESIADGIIVLDRQARILNLNSAMHNYLGRLQNEFIGKPITAVFPELSDWQKNAHRHTPHQAEINRHAATFNLEIRPLRTNQILGNIITMRDITEQKRVQEALTHAKKLDSLGTLAGGVAHDFNNLLVAIIGQNSVAMAKLPNDHPAQQHLQKTRDAAEKAAQLTHHMLAFSGHGQFQMSAHDINQLICGAQIIQQLEIHPTITTDFDLNPTPLSCYADKFQFEQMLEQLVTNSMEAIDEQNGRIQILTARKLIHSNEAKYSKITGQPLPIGPYVCLCIADNGCGIPPEQLENIFDPFYSSKFIGRGLGLSAVLGIVRGHQGGIHVASHPKTGTTIEIVLPAKTLA